MDSRQAYTAVFEPSAEQPIGTRLDVFWTNRLADRAVSRARIQEAITTGEAGLNGAACRKPGYKLRGDEALTLSLTAPDTAVVAEDAPLAVVYQDAALVVLDKPAGLTVHPAPGLPDGTLVNRLLGHFPAMREMGGPRPGIVHRLDKDTSGLIVVALTEASRQSLAAMFADRRTHKTYLALVHGRPQHDEGKIRLPIGRDPDNPTKMAVVKKGGRDARSQYRVVWSAPDGRASLLEVIIATGRTHQIRVHLTALGHPLVGDAVYGPQQHAAWKRRGGPAARLAERQMLHAWKLSFPHPVSGETMAFRCPVPRDFWRLLLLLGRRPQRVGLVGMPGCGKSTVLGALAAAGFPTFSADAEVAALYMAGGDGAHMLSRRFGEAVLTEDGAVNKAWLLAAMQNSDKTRREVMELVHPLVKGRMQAFFQEHARARAVFAEAPLLLEAGWHKGREVDFVVGVRCDASVRRQRLAGRGWSEAVMDAMDGWQWSEAKKFDHCRYILENTGSLDALKAETRHLLDTLAQARRADALSRFAWLVEQGYAPAPGQAMPPGGPA